MLYVAVRAARKAGDLIARAYDERADLKVRQKSDRDYVTDVDQSAEALIVREISKHYPDHGIIGEEMERSVNPDAAIQWYVDPLDGTSNFIHGYPHFAVSISAWKGGKPMLAVIHDPIRDETFEARNGGGAFLNRRRLRVSHEKRIEHAVFASGLPSYQRDTIDLYQQRMDACMRSMDSFRRGGSAALDLAYVAAGRLDAYWEAGLKSWDIAAGYLLVQEAGGMATGLDSGTIDLNKGDILAANPDLHPQVAALLKV
ncbi:MAG: inositol monophosphatase [Zetaproteobacteria bacterium CG12_big_fil_rev_8_21_14_0_65_54_13]|nr:MAG: inositol monophosphatase [Zetaproteobacteria bacterium CG23_combo_of_CG06-09_8_20_14_all_54_7]PIW47973.1 MAG: inositol monophosphatase [Zetaproteobacteria bacterium CG12_big_fil_rev_8_21_14_0_65_54_13]PIX54691.1 MAG: inositol monophosphatase [Zetaproteobacteria bacterium CG_4_10_14_3_um_filter_54_28]PJA30950.1 MAG: inositol monophosphatase [Zetaproteobacteria bacterium CG_4_9_14_3_um_filter_54_145]